MNNDLKNLVRLARTIRKRRMELGITQLEVAETCGVSQSTVSEWENAEYWPSAKRIRILAEFLIIPIEDILPS